MLDFRLKVFYTVASEKSFTKAAHKHNITQPAVSKHIQELERIYGITLLERRGSSILVRNTPPARKNSRYKIPSTFVGPS